MHVKISPAMKRLTILLFLLIIAIISAIVLGLPLPQAIQDLLPNAIVKPNPVDKPGYTLLFQEEFEQPQLDLTRWNTQYWWGRVNGQELQYYEEDAFSINDGKLNIQARRNKLHDKNYTSGVITTLNTFSFQYGYVEVYAKLPKGRGLWPAFWLLSTTRNDRSEIDVFEVIGHDPNTVYMTAHYINENGEARFSQGKYKGTDYSAGYHIYAVEWTKDSIVWYIDGVERHRENNNIPHESVYLLANLAVGGKWPGNPDSKTVFPANYQIDYIRVYQPN